MSPYPKKPRLKNCPKSIIFAPISGGGSWFRRRRESEKGGDSMRDPHKRKKTQSKKKIENFKIEWGRGLQKPKAIRILAVCFEAID